MTPAVSVLMSVHNGERFLRPAVESILGQTFTDFEFIVVDDGSTDRSAEIVASYDDARLRLLRNADNLGLSRSLNRGIEEARGRYVARMDADDVSLPERLARQVAFMDAHPRVGACGTWAKEIDASGEVIGTRQTPTGGRLAHYYWIPSPLIHPSAMIRADLLKRLRYDPSVRYAQDFNLWLRIVKAGFELGNLAEFLFLYRVHAESISDSKLEAQLRSSYESFREHVRPLALDYETFITFFYGTCRLTPLRRARVLSGLAKAVGRPRRAYLPDEARYAARWLRQRAYEYACAAPALQPLRRARRQLKARLQ